MQDEFGEAMDWSQLGQMGGIPQAGQYNAPTLQTGIGQENLQRNIGQTDVQGQLNSQGLQNVDSSQRYNQAAGDALYGRATSRLDPQWEQWSEQREVQLRNQGLRTGDQAYDRAMTTMNQNRTDAYQQAGFGADIGAGAEASRMYGMDMGLRGQQFGERTGMGQFANQAAGQQFGQGLQAGQFANQVSGQQFGQGLQAGQFGNQAMQNQYNMGLRGGGQQFGEEMQQSNLQSQQRQQQIAEQMQQRGQSLNEMTAIMQGQQVGMPSMPNFQTAGAAQPTDYLGAANMQYQGALDQYGMQSANNQALMGNIGSLAGGAMGFSDRRLKRDIKPVGVWNNIKFYIWTYVWGEQGFGVMADEVRHITGAVVRHPSGFDMVDYGVIYGN